MSDLAVKQLECSHTHTLNHSHSLTHSLTLTHSLSHTLSDSLTYIRYGREHKKETMKERTMSDLATKQLEYNHDMFSILGNRSNLIPASIHHEYDSSSVQWSLSLIFEGKAPIPFGKAYS